MSKTNVSDYYSYLARRGFHRGRSDSLAEFLHDFFADRWEEDLTEEENVESIKEDLISLIRSLNNSLDIGLNI